MAVELKATKIETWDSALAPIHPGEMLSEEFLKPLGVSQSRAAADMGISFRRMHEVINGKRSITAETAILLSAYLGTSAELWTNLQSSYDLKVARPAMKNQIACVRVLPRPDLQPASERD